MAVGVIDYTDVLGMAAVCSAAAGDLADEQTGKAGGAIGKGLHASLITLSERLVALDKAKANAAAYRALPLGTVTNQQVYEAQLAAAQALEVADAAQAAYARALDAAPDELYARLLPRQPAVNSAHLNRTHSETVKWLEALGGGPADKAQAVGTLLATALARDDRVLAFILTSGPMMDLPYSRLGIDPNLLKTFFQHALIAANPNRRSAKLLAKLQRPGSVNTLRRAQVAAQYTLHHQRNG